MIPEPTRAADAVACKRVVVKSACGAVPGLLPVRSPGRSPNPPCRSLLSRL